MTVILGFLVEGLNKAITAENEERCPTKKQSSFQKRTAFMSGISPCFWLLVVLYGFRNFCLLCVATLQLVVLASFSYMWIKFSLVSGNRLKTK